jgi:hypothetical protein
MRRDADVGRLQAAACRKALARGERFGNVGRNGKLSLLERRKWFE